MTEGRFSLPPDKLRQFAEDGYFILEGVIDAPILAMLRGECAHFVAREDAKMDALASTCSTSPTATSATTPPSASATVPYSASSSSAP